MTGTSSSSATDGFTLMEMLVALAILALLSVIAVPAFRSGDAPPPETETDRAVALLQQTRERARRKGIDQKVEFRSAGVRHEVIFHGDGSSPTRSVPLEGGAVITLNPLSGEPELRR